MVDQIRVAVSTAASGTWDVDAGGAETPVAAMFYVTRATTDDTIASDGVLGWGVTDGTNQNCLSVSHEDGQGSSDTDRKRSTTRCVALHNVASAFDFEFSFNSWITGGVRLDIDNAAPSGFLLTAIFFYSDDVSDVSVQSIGLGSTTSAVDYTGLSFESDVIFTGHIYTSSTGNNVHAPLGLGVVYNDNSATPTQKSMAICGDSGTSAGGDQNTFIDNNSGLCATLLGARRWELTFSDIDSTGFTHTSTASTSTQMHVLCMKLATGVSFSLFDMNWPTSGNYAETSPGFEPDFGSIYSLVGPTGYNSFSTSISNAALSIATFDSSVVYTNTITDHDGEDPTVCKSLSSDQLRILDSDGSTDAVLASSYAFDADGWDFTLSANPSATVYGFGWAISGASGGGATDITATGGMSFGSSAGLNATGTLAGTSALSFSLSSALNASGALTGASSITFSDSLTLTGAGSLQASEALSFGANAELKGVGLLSVSSVLSFGSNATANAIGSLQAVDSIAFGSSAELNGTGSLTSTSNIVFGSSADLSQANANALNTTASITFGSNATLSATGTLSASSNLSFGDTLSLNATGALSASSSLTFGDSCALSGVGALQAEAPLNFGSSAELTTAIADALIASAAMSFGSSATLNAAGTLTATGGLTLSTTAVLSQPGAAISVEGLEYTMGGTRLHFTISGDPLHYTIN